MAKFDKLALLAKKYRNELFEKFVIMKQGHPGSTFSILEILISLHFGKFIRFRNKRFFDRLIVSKGHATVGMYPILKDYGIIKKKDWESWGIKKKTLLRVFGNIFIPGIDATTGSLGHGIGIGCGLAYSYKTRNIDRRVFVLISEGELYEGSTWEALLFASHYNLDNLTIIIDINSLIILGKTKDCINLGNIKKKISSFDLKTIECDGHNFKSLFKALSKKGKNKPKCILAKTVKGKGFSLMENKPNWHYWNNLKENEIVKLRNEIK